jgi:FkbM family methyltransferase
LVAGTNEEGLTWARLSSGPEVLVPLGDYVGWAAYFTGDLDRKITEVIKRIVRPGDHVVDIGANLGLVTLQLASLVGPSGLVYSFEPNPSLNELMTRSIERNSFQNVRLHTCALGSQEGILSLSFPPQNAGKGSLSKTRQAPGWSTAEVRVETFASVAAAQGIREVRLLKLDVEGFEHEVLQGASSWLANHPPDTILFESNEKRHPDDADPVLSLLQAHGYSFYAIPKQLYSLKLAPLARSGALSTLSHDILAVTSERTPEVLGKFTLLG